MSELEHKQIDVSKLKFSKTRDIRENAVEALRNRIVDNGFNPALPLSVIDKEDDTYMVADGNHRLTVVLELEDITTLPCIVYPKGTDLYKLSFKSNKDTDTYAPVDIFDYLDAIGKLKDKGKTQKQIGRKLDWSESKVKQYGSIISGIVTTNLNLAKSCQEGRVTNKVTNVTFTEGWFREILKLDEDHQHDIIDEYIQRKGDLTGIILKKKVNKLLMYEAMCQYVLDNLVNQENINNIYDDIENGVFHNCSQLVKYIKQLNEESKTVLINDNCLNYIPKIDDDSISMLLTDPPYGTAYVSSRRNYENDITVDIENDDESAFDLLQDMLTAVKPKLIDEAHVYIFCTWKNYSKFEHIVEQFFKIKTVIVWNKMNHGIGDMAGSYGEKYELIIFATNGNRVLNKPRPANILEFSKVSENEKQHSMQKPTDLLELLIKTSTSPGEIILDPFMGVGSVPVACNDRNPYIGIELDERFFKIAQQRVKS